MSFCHSLYIVCHKVAPKLASYVKKRIKGEREAWELTQKEAETASYFPDCPQKPLRQIQAELKHLCRNGNGSWINAATLSHYFLCGLDIQGSDIHDYVFQEQYDKLRDKKQPAFASMLKHKYYTAAYLHSQGINISLPLGEINSQGEIFYQGAWKPLKGVLNLDNRRCYFAKLKDAYQGRGHVVIEYQDGRFQHNGKAISDEEAYKLLDNHTIEPFIAQHSALNAIYADAVSNVRIITLSHQDEIILYAQAILVGSGGERASNLGFGGLIVSVDPNGVMRGRGIKKCASGFGSYIQHPDSGVTFDGFQIPYWHEALHLAKSAHADLRDIHSIGWDIAITPTGPIIIEANDDWGTMTQCFGGHPHKDLIRQYYDLKD